MGEDTGKEKQSITTNPLLQMAAVIACVLAITWLAHESYTSGGSYRNRDFMSLYAGGRAVLEGLDPYDDNVWGPLRQRLGSEWIPDSRAPFPYWTFLITAPFALLSLDWAAAAWITFSLVLLAVSIGLILSLPLPEQPTYSLRTLLVLALPAFFFRGGLVTLTNGQLTAVLLFTIALFLALETKGYDFPAGAALALIILKPNPFILFVPTLALWLLLRRRWSIIAGAGSMGLGLLILTVVLRPGWLQAWMEVRGKSALALATPTVWGLGYEINSEYWAAVGLILAIAVTAVAGWFLFRGPRLSLPEVTAFALATSVFVTPYAWAYEHLLLLIPLLLTAVSFPRRPAGLLLYIVLAFILPWLMLAVADQRDSDTMAFLVPLLAGLVLVASITAKRHEALAPPVS